MVSDNEKFNLLAPLSISFKLERLDSKAQATADLPKYRMDGAIAQLELSLSNSRLVELLRIQKFASHIWTPQETGTFTPLGSDTLLPHAPEFVHSDRLQGFYF